MKRIEVDIHTHTVFSGHAFGTVTENVLAAREAGLKGIGLSDHAPGIPGTCDPIIFRNLHEIPRNYHGVNVYYGVENNVLNDGSMTLPEHILDFLDYNMVGIHGTCYQDQGIEKNTDNMIRCMQHPKTFFISHPDDGTWPVDYERFVLAAKKNGVALELNNSHVREPWRKNCLENMHTYLELCMKYGTCIFLGSDAHIPERVGKFDEALALLEEIGFDEDLIVNNSEEKFREFIHFKG